MVTNCDLFYEVESGGDCAKITSTYNIPLATFYAWNPAVGSSCKYLELNVYVCIGVLSSTSMTITSTLVSSSTTNTGVSTPSPVQTGIVSNCNAFYEAEPGNTCDSISEAYDIALATFHAWNPAVGSSCQYLELNVYVCIGVSSSSSTSSLTSTITAVSTPSPVQTGIVSNCDAFYEVESGNDCDTIVAKYDLTLAEFYAWNPAVGSSCQYLELNVYVCVGVS